MNFTSGCKIIISNSIICTVFLITVININIKYSVPWNEYWIYSNAMILVIIFANQWRFIRRLLSKVQKLAQEK